jgi:hypothetical protein
VVDSAAGDIGRMVDGGTPLLSSLGRQANAQAAKADRRGCEFGVGSLVGIRASVSSTRWGMLSVGRSTIVLVWTMTRFAPWVFRCWSVSM